VTQDSGSWDESYRRDAPPPWDIGHPQPRFAQLAETGALAGRLFDCGCGTGEHSLLAASLGADVTGVDLSATAIAKARRKAEERGLSVRFEVGNALELPAPEVAFDVLIDSGVFHSFDDTDRLRYVASLRRQLRIGGACYLMCFSERQPGDWGPRRVRAAELREAFADDWAIELERAIFEVNEIEGVVEVQAWFVTARRTR